MDDCIYSKPVRNIAWAIQAARRDGSAEVAMIVFEAVAMRWVHQPMIGNNNNLSAEEIAKLLEQEK
jgi:hypothetical protein